MSINLSFQSIELCTFNRDTARLHAMAFEMPGIAQGKETVVSEKPSGITSRIDSQDEVWPTSFHHGHTSIVATFIYTIALEFNSLANTIWGILAYALAEIGKPVLHTFCLCTCGN